MSDNMKEVARIHDELFGIPNNEKRIDSFASEIVALLKPTSDKENVLAKWPDARECYTFQYGEEIKAVGSGDRQIHGTGKTFKAAWADAERRLDKDAGQKIIDARATHERLTGESS